MSDLFYQCTRNDAPAQQGLLGQGTLPYPEVIANRAIPQIDVGGDYATDELSGAMFLATALAQPDDESTPDETLEDLGLLLSLYAELQRTGKATAEELNELRKRGEAIPVIGPLVFSPANLPAVVGSLTGIAHATSQARRVIDLLNIPNSLKRELRNWATTRGRAGARSASKTFRRRIKLVYVNGNLVFKIPASTLAPYYALRGLTAGGGHVHVPVHGANQALNTRVTPNTATYATRGLGRVLGSNWVGAALSMGPQAAIDAQNSADMREFAERSAYSQATNAAVFATGVVVAGVAAVAGAPVIAAFALALGAGLVVQFVLNKSGFNDWVGDKYMELTR
ncbi:MULTISPECIES: hypothetical protein [unclassified Brenneria]|uniref:hypothetical protein n=1 Tax=unclassified Brenneria TaxID=2634434 RepID=UPI0018F105B4|nr:hypothetical protein [Brenneria sp. L3-3C-1]MBJ7223505.1 hypothetical protein [Brenneria sp. L3-3C-1]MEE3644746.1 hypothetical protein [Brenneria sp. L3_3C_1]